MEKMVYERPVMRAQVFQANASVATCSRIPIISSILDYFKVMVGGKTYIFDTTPVTTVNMGSGNSQYYYEECNDSGIANNNNDKGQGNGRYFLEYSEQKSSSYGKPTFYLYEDNDNSGYGIPFLWWNDGKNSLQNQAFGDDGSLNLGAMGVIVSDYLVSDNPVTYEADSETQFSYTAS